jgi:hypothetical protein
MRSSYDLPLLHYFIIIVVKVLGTESMRGPAYLLLVWNESKVTRRVWSHNAAGDGSIQPRVDDP